ncbi:MAG: 16S rRNA (cytosine(1402)-N(4))-methyltransferase RsmH [Candidatus Saccharimonadales bacterium]
MHQNKNQNKNTDHEPVLLAQVLKYLDPKAGETYLDLTAGYGGHARAMLELTGAAGAALVDRDSDSIRVLRGKFPDDAVDVRHQDFLAASHGLAAEGRRFDLILADLGVSSPHLNEGKRGFAINRPGPLDMRMDRTQELTAGTIVNTFSEAQLSEILKRYGEEPKADRIARGIVQARPLSTTAELAAVAAKAWRPGRSRIHPATRTFQALRIAVNDELGQLEQSLPLWLDLLAPGGRIAVISFHSLEDRMVKQTFKEASTGYEASLRLVNGKPVTAAPSETVHNPRARSAKLRAAVKINKKGNSDANSGKR